MTEILPPEQQRWARRLAESQTQRDELVRLLGLLAQLGVGGGGGPAPPPPRPPAPPPAPGARPPTQT
jgi:hypothetical protein